MRKKYPYATRWEENIVVVLHICGARANILHFFYHQDTESELCKVEMIISQPISTYKKISKSIWENNIHTLKYERKILC